MRYLAVLLLAVVLAACGGETESTADQAPDDTAAEYQEEVRETVSESVVRSLAREWEVDEDKARCVLGELRPYQIEEVASDPEVQAVFENCGVDPSVVK